MKPVTRIYFLLVTVLSAGWIWIIANSNILYPHSVHHSLCLFKNITGVACPSCGSTRAVESILRGDFAGGIYINPLGMIILLLMVMLPVWILYDGLSGKTTLMNTYRRIEIILRTKWCIPFIVPLLINWIWNIYKGI